ncbi:hypothetical protein [Cryptosporangium japonicum]|uniref:Lipoprotein n=1 Tax=Cryptosporangium japonicum TaxID=80872 RepID=A0ABP3DJA0_9ACTN
MRFAVKSSRRVRVLGAGLALAASVVLTGCGTDSVAQTVKEAVQTPQQKLIDAAVKPTTAPYDYTVVQQGDPKEAETFTGSVNPPAKAYNQKSVDKTEEYTLSLELRVIDQKSWVKVNLEADPDAGFVEYPKKWMALDQSRLTTKLVFGPQDEDPVRLDALFTSIVDATEDSPGKFSGTINLAEQPKSEFFAAETMKALGDKANALPFTTTVTDGVVTEFVLSAPATSVSKAQTYTVTYQKPGSGTPITAPPAAETTETPDSVYELLAS